MPFGLVQARAEDRRDLGREPGFAGTARLVAERQRPWSSIARPVSSRTCRCPPRRLIGVLRTLDIGNSGDRRFARSRAYRDPGSRRVT
jgi:hypothetical protein